MPSPRSVLVGRYAEASTGGVVFALLFDWELTVETDTADATAHGDVWKIAIGLDTNWRLRARGYVVPASTAHYINQHWATGQPSTTFTVACYSGTVGAGTKIFEGVGLPVRGNLTASMALAEQE